MRIEFFTLWVVSFRLMLICSLCLSYLYVKYKGKVRSQLASLAKTTKTTIQQQYGSYLPPRNYEFLFLQFDFCTDETNHIYNVLISELYRCWMVSEPGQQFPSASSLCAKLSGQLLSYRYQSGIKLIKINVYLNAELFL